MIQTAVYQKSSKGLDAIARRDHALSPRLRSLLILVDGKRSLADLARLAGGDPADALAQLDALGMVQPVETAAVASAAAPVDKPPAAALAVSLPEAQRFAVRRLTDLLGPTAEDLCMRIESARSPNDFLSVLRRAELVLRDFGGPQLAARFHADMQAHRPA